MLHAETSLPDQLELSPLTDATRKERRALLLTSVVAAAVVFGGFTPTKIEQLGITFSPTQLRALTALLLLVGIYFLVEFGMHSRVEKVAWRRYVATIQARALPSLFDRFSELERAAQSFSAPRLTDEVRVLRKIVRQLEPLIDLKAHDRATTAITGYSRLAYAFESGEQPRKVIAQVVADLDEMRFPVWRNLGTVTSWRDFERRYIIAASRILELMSDTLGEKVGFRLNQPSVRAIVYRYRLARLRERLYELLRSRDSYDREASVADLTSIWSKFRRLPSYYQDDGHPDTDDRHVVEVNEDLGELGRFEALDRERSYPQDWLSLDLRWIMTELGAAPYAFLGMEDSLNRTFKRIATRAWFDLDLPLILGAATILATTAVWLAA